MQPYGSDRLAVREDGVAILSCREPKRLWRPRAARTFTTAEHPGTAVLWDGEYYEVVAMETLPHAVRYALAPWSESHTMRGVDQYDERSEAVRAQEAVTARNREAGAVAATLLGFITGHLPALVQEQLASETGVNAPLLTIISAVPPVIVFAVLLRISAGARIAMRANPIPFGVMAFAIYMMLDSAIRFGVALTQKRPMGSLPGLIAYAVYYSLSSHRPDLPVPFAAARGMAASSAELTPEQHLEGALALREPLFTLLPAGDQQRLARLHGFDFRRTAASIAWVLLIVSLIGVVSSIGTLTTEPRLSAAVSLLVAGWLLGEQIFRLAHLRDGPVGSVLGHMLRPFVSSFLVEEKRDSQSSPE